MAAALLLALAAAAAPAAAGQPPVVEQVVAVVRNPAGSPPRAVTLTKLTEEARIALVGRGAIEAAFRPLDLAALRAGLEWLVSQMLVADEAARLRVDDVDRDEVRAAVRQFQARFPDAAAYRRFLEASDLPEEELAATLARTLRVNHYLATRVGRAAHVSDQEVERYIRDQGREATPAVREAVRSYLDEQKRQARVTELVAELRGRAEVRVLAPLAHGGDGA
ncbi:MAG TPA: hypothetical protein VLU43_17585 [Anaeromyxobacteraceae bacterium]|nr:hypothetical protein [Anaeromyxobacteraceae bacterium]